ncbi:hypothetical protein F444_13623, partial [Phytophthora nicotianae P1976]
DWGLYKVHSSRNKNNLTPGERAATDEILSDRNIVEKYYSRSSGLWQT